MMGKQDVQNAIIGVIFELKGEFTKEQILDRLKKSVEYEDLEKLVDDNLSLLCLTGVIRKTRDNKYTN